MHFSFLVPSCPSFVIKWSVTYCDYSLKEGGQSDTSASRNLTSVPPWVRPCLELLYFLVPVPVTTVTVRLRHRLAEPRWHQSDIGNSSPCRGSVWRWTGASDAAGRKQHALFTREPSSLPCFLVAHVFIRAPVRWRRRCVCMFVEKKFKFNDKNLEKETAWSTTSSSAFPAHNHNIWDLCCCKGDPSKADLNVSVLWMKT